MRVKMNKFLKLDEKLIFDYVLRWTSFLGLSW